MWTVGKKSADGSARGNSKAIGWTFFEPLLSLKTAKPQSLYCGNLSQTPAGRRKRSSRRAKSLTDGTKDASKLPTSTTASFASGRALPRSAPAARGGGGVGKPA